MDIPFKSSHKFPELIGLKVDPVLRSDIEKLKGHGVDTAALFRDALRKAVNHALEVVGEEAS